MFIAMASTIIAVGVPAKPNDDPVSGLSLTGPAYSTITEFSLAMRGRSDSS